MVAEAASSARNTLRALRAGSNRMGSESVSGAIIRRRGALGGDVFVFGSLGPDPL